MVLVLAPYRPTDPPTSFPTFVAMVKGQISITVRDIAVTASVPTTGEVLWPEGGTVQWPEGGAVVWPT